ncbi:DUF418 domain-containing protein [uncultured Microbulbifer sp.]|uniref:DUF418 domain-containing protein n=1 Tax=uncultured Microbulbifer sp. TaxID=348147 RepID=UPI002607DBC4|nr:DUF418 domain-containing protein [uncultured Microbulbifer sp.]
MSEQIQSTKDRVILLDAMRGFALCGIIFANLVSFTGFYSLSLSQIQALLGIDRAILFAIDFFVEGKFYSIFAMLLGAGCWLQYSRFQQHQRGFSVFWLRRMLILFVLGISHMYLIWHGDILTLYSLLGVCLLLFLRVENRLLMPCILALLTFPLLIHVVLAVSYTHPFWGALNSAADSLRQWLGYQGVSLLVLRAGGGAEEVFWGNVLSAIPRAMSYLKTGRPFQVLGQFLLGVYLVRIYLQGNASIPSWRSVFSLLCLGALLNLGYAYIKYETGSPFSVSALGLVQGVIYHLGCIVLALGYMALFYRLWHAGAGFRNLARMGRMALTMYLMQSILCVLLFYAYGLGLMGRVPFYSIVVFGSGILLIQFLFARFWLGRFQFGPVEYLWRRLSYSGEPRPSTKPRSGIA